MVDIIYTASVLVGSKAGSTKVKAGSGQFSDAHKGNVDEVALHNAMATSNLFLISLELKLVCRPG